MKPLSVLYIQPFENDIFAFLGRRLILIIGTVFFTLGQTAVGQPADAGGASPLSELGLSVIPYPQEVTLHDDNFYLDREVTIVLDESASENDRFAAQDMLSRLKEEWNIDATVSTTPGNKTIRLTRNKAPKDIGEEGYRLLATENRLTIEAHGEAGLFYGSQTLTQLIKESQDTAAPYIPGLEIIDWPDIKERAMHYDTKHHQDKKEYVKKFIRDLARYKTNILVWEWEDKFLYPSHPEIGAPGAFTMEKMQEFTRYARQYHIQLVPLVQGLGHVSFILKWPQFAHLREVEASNWEFCPLKEGTYDLLFDLWEDAIAATPGSEYIHIGSDETYELGQGVKCGCKQKAEEIGESGLYHIFLDRAAEHLSSMDRKVMAWERPMGWKMGSSPIQGGAQPAEDIVLTESYSYGTEDYNYVRESKELGYPVFAYDPNPGIEPLFLPYYHREQGQAHVIPGTEEKEYRTGSLENSYHMLTSAAKSGVFDGMIRTSWDDAGLHNQVWMMQFILAAEYSWSGRNPSLGEFQASFFKNYYGNDVEHADELFRLLNEAAYYYWNTLERKVWHFGTIGKTHLPDLPRGDHLEYNPFWNDRHEEIIERSEEMNRKMERAIEICEVNISNAVKNEYDFEVFKTIANLTRHTSQVYLDLSSTEEAITEAHEQRFLSHAKAYEHLTKAEDIVEEMLVRRHVMFDNLVEVWEKTRLPKGLSTKDKNFFHRQDRARHFANRRADMSYLIYDEQLLNAEEYLKDLNKYSEWYRETFIE